jgi:DNA-binding response OmpR family regulator
MHNDNERVILIAEDDPFISRMYQTKLQGAGFEVRVVTNGREAVDAINSARPGLLMLDLDMPEMTGFQALSKLRADGFDFDGMPIIILTNSSKAEDRDRALEFSADYLVKSDITPREVLDIINQKLNLTKEIAPSA